MKTELTKLDPDKDQNNATPRAKRWAKSAITLLLLSALIVTGIAAYYARQEWREMYLRVMKHGNAWSLQVARN